MTAQELTLSESQTPLQSRRFLPWMLVLFVGSGCAALVYEIVWLQLLQLVIGASAISLGVLLGVFMGGMCLGSFILPRLIPSSWHPLKVYAWLEIGIAVFGLLIIGFGEQSGIHYISDWYTNSVAAGPKNVWMRAAVAAICLVPPTLLMGATLPAIARWVQATPQGVSWMGFFYGGNIVGAVIGCLLTGFVLLPALDMPKATYIAMAMNIAVAALALLLASMTPHTIPDTETVAEEPLHEESADNSMVYVVIAMSGMCALGAEVVWTRLLSLLLGATVYTFSIILAVFLVGLGIGSSVGAGLARNLQRPRLALGICQLLICGAVGWAAWVISQSLPYWPIDPSIDLGKELDTARPWFTFQLDIVRAAWAILPAAILWGASFPLALASIASRGRDPGKMVGGVYAANTVGAIVGAMAFALAVVPRFHTDGAQKIIIALAGVSALLALFPFLWRKNVEENRTTVSIGGIIAAVLATAAIVGLVISVVRVPWIMVAWGRFTSTYLKNTDPILRDEKFVPTGSDAAFSRRAIFLGEGINVSVAVTKDSSGWQYFHGAGKVQASTDPQDMRLQRMLGHLSVLAHQKPDEVKDVLVVACGAGVTAGSFVPYPKIENITICDIEPLVPTQVTPMFSSVNYGITDGIKDQNPKKMKDGKLTVEVAFDDGRHYIRTLPKDKKFDVITSDPIDPWVKGCAALNTVEYYQMCRDHLKPGGVMSLWIPLYESNIETAKSVIGTFFSVFPNGIIFSNDLPGGEGYDAVLFGTVDAPNINLDEVQKLIDTPEYSVVKQSIAEVGFNKSGDGSIVAELMATYAGRGKELDGWMKTAPVLQLNTDRNLKLQYLAGMYLNSYMGGTILDDIFKYYKFPDDVFVGSADNVQALRRALERDGRARYSGRAAAAN